MNSEKKVDTKSEDRINPRVWYILLLPVFLLGLLIFGYFYLAQEEVVIEEPKIEEPIEPKESPSGLEGEVYLTLSPFGYEDEDEGFHIEPNIYRFDLVTRALEPLFDDEYAHYYMASFSPDLQKMVFTKSYEEGRNKVMVQDVETEKSRGITLFLDFLPRNPRFSPDGEDVIYWGSNDLLQPEKSSIYISTLDGQQEQVANGAYPVYSPDGESIVFMKNDGLYIMDLETTEKTMVLDLYDEKEFPFLDLESIGWYSFRFNISPEGEKLIVTDTLSPSNRLFDINSWDPFEYELISEPDFSQPIWPVFSPDGRHLALEEYRFDEKDELEYFHLSLYDLDSLEIVEGISLDDYEMDYIWVSDWIIR